NGFRAGNQRMPFGGPVDADQVAARHVAGGQLAQQLVNVEQSSAINHQVAVLVQNLPSLTVVIVQEIRAVAGTMPKTVTRLDNPFFNRLLGRSDHILEGELA